MYLNLQNCGRSEWYRCLAKTWIYRSSAKVRRLLLGTNTVLRNEICKEEVNEKEPYKGFKRQPERKDIKSAVLEAKEF